MQRHRGGDLDALDLLRDREGRPVGRVDSPHCRYGSGWHRLVQENYKSLSAYTAGV
jgi:hypothetical protein